MKNRHAVVVALAVLLSLAAGCAITQTVLPVSGREISLLCIKRNPEVFMSEFVTELKSQIEAKGISTLVYGDVLPAECRYRLEYTANWRWDLAMYLRYADLRIFDVQAPMGRATYDARAGGANLEKFGRTADKLRGLVDELFGGKRIDAASCCQPGTGK